MNTFHERMVEMDRTDELGSFREQFVFAEPATTYLDGNSLGRLPARVPQLVQRVVTEEWGRELIGSWNDHWLPMVERIRGKLAQLLGVESSEILLGDSTSIQLFKLASAIGRHFAGSKVITDRYNFPSDLYVLEQCARNVGRALILAEDVSPEDDFSDVAYLSLSHVRFASGFRFDLPAFHGKAPMIWDLSHSVGVVPVSLRDATAAVGCTYKYLNGGPGAPAFMYLAAELVEALENPVPGWFGHAAPFGFTPEYVPSPGIERFQISTPPVLSVAAMEPGLDLVLEAGIARIWEKACLLTQAFIAATQELTPELRCVTPLSPESRGAHVSLAHPEAWRICQSLIQHHRVIPDFRAPDLVRFGFSPLTTRFIDVYEAVFRLREVLDRESFRQIPQQRPRIT
ncbi:MAG: aminotransferase class V-fold PLP-dependent enzyme [Fimbriimonadaceae bacterium]|nr:aminotransferase class V-fold PLP-dependent enzyme [Fimbriimonadaceae bacterium]